MYFIYKNVLDKRKTVDISCFRICFLFMLGADIKNSFTNKYLIIVFKQEVSF